jgi:TolB protein
MNLFRCSAATLLCLLTLAPVVRSQTEMQGRVTTNNAYRLPVALEELELSGGSATPEALENLKDLMEAIRQDLAFSGYFKIVRFDSLYLKLMGQSQMDRKAWSHLGAEYIGSGRVTPSGDGYRLMLKLEGTSTGEVIFEKTFTGLWERSRQTAHQVAGEIIYYLWGGRTLIFETQIMACWETGKAKNLYLLDYDGYRPRAVTNYGDINISPSWFPSGDRVVFTSYRDGNPDLWLVLLKNNSTQKISSRPGLNTAPAVWPDGRFVVATLSIDGNAELYLLSESGKIVRRLTNHQAIESEPSVSPDGRQIAFTSDRLGSPQVFVMEADGSNIRRVTYQGTYNASPAWSPRGDKIAYVSRSDRGTFDVFTVRPDGTGIERLTTTGSNENPDWSPDGYHLVYSSLRGGQRNLFTITFDGTNERQITSGGGFTNPAWGPYPRP